MTGHSQVMKYLAPRGDLTRPESTTLLHRRQHHHPEWFFPQKRLRNFFPVIYKAQDEHGKRTLFFVCFVLGLLRAGLLGSEIVGAHIFVYSMTAALGLILALDRLTGNNPKLCYGVCKSNQELREGRGKHGMQYLRKSPGGGRPELSPKWWVVGKWGAVEGHSRGRNI